MGLYGVAMGGSGALESGGEGHWVSMWCLLGAVGLCRVTVVLTTAAPAHRRLLLHPQHLCRQRGAPST